MGTASIAGEHSILSARGHFVEVIERMLSSEHDDHAWAASIVDVARLLFPTAAHVSFQMVEFDSEGAARRCRLASPDQPTRAMLEQTIAAGHPACPAGFGWIAESPSGDAKPRPSIGNVCAAVAHPVPGIVTAIGLSFERKPEVGRHAQRVMTQLALHLDAAHRLRLRPDRVLAVLSESGRMLFREPDAPSTDDLTAQVLRIRRARSREYRSRTEGVALWSALLHGRVSLVPRRNGSRIEYVVLANPHETQAFRALSEAEASALRLASQGISNKLVAYGLGLSQPAVSMHLSRAASKIGLASRPELVRVAALLVRDERSEMSDAVLTKSEREILTLLERGMSNNEIASLRSRSVRTIANQVASLLKKTRASSRRELLVRAARSAAE